MEVRVVSFWNELTDRLEEFTDATIELAKGVADATKELGEGLAEVAEETIEDIKDDPIKYIADSARDIVKAAPALLLPTVSVRRFGKELIDTAFRGNVKPRPGSLVYRDLYFGYAEHSGIYVGDDQIVELDGQGRIREVSPTAFIGDGTGTCIYVSCYNEHAVGEDIVAQRALERVGKGREYHLLLNNCHQFSSGCISGDFENSDNFLWMVKHTCEKSMGANNWRVWDFFH
jgi:hypothetical protein